MAFIVGALFICLTAIALHVWERIDQKKRDAAFGDMKATIEMLQQTATTWQKRYEEAADHLARHHKAQKDKELEKPSVVTN